MTSRKGMSPADLSGAALALVMIGVSIAIGVWINQQISTTSFNTVTITNESVTFSDGVVGRFKLPYISVLRTVQNGTVDMSLANFSYVDDYRGVLPAFSANIINTTNEWKVTYTGYNSSEYLIMKNSTEGLKTFAEWTPILAIVIAAAVVIGSIVVWFKFGKETY